MSAYQHVGRQQPTRRPKRAPASALVVVFNEGTAGAQSALKSSLASHDPSHLRVIPIAEVFRSRGSAARAVKSVCEAPVVVFECEGFEPGIMLLIALRAVARRGVTLLIDAFPPETGPRFIPYCLQSAMFVNARALSSAGLKQHVDDLAHRSLVEHETDNEYRDLPAYSALRLNACIDSEQQDELLVLHPYSADYATVCWLSTLFPILSAAGPVRRLAEPTSTRLATDAFHLRLRDHRRCAADWTCLRPDLFYELGVRIGANGRPSLHVIADGRHWKPPHSMPAATTPFGKWPCRGEHAVIAERNACLAQTRDLVALFAPVAYAIGGGCDEGAGEAIGQWLDRLGESEVFAGIEPLLQRAAIAHPI